MADATKLSISFTIPELLVDKIEVSRPYQNYNSRGNTTSFGVDLNFHEMQISRSLKSSEFYALRGKIEETLRTWENKYQRHLDKFHKEKRSRHVDELNQEAKDAIDALNNILSHTINIDDTVDWNAVKRKDAFRIKPAQLFSNGKEPFFMEFN